MTFIEKIKSKINNPAFIWLSLLFLGVLSYGIYLGWMGFYWDDWGWIYFGKAFGKKTLLLIDQVHRPISGVLFYIGSILFGENPLGWQIYNFIARWLSAVSLWWALSKLWPKQKERGLWIAFIFLIYPGFNHQFISVNSIRHVLPYSLYFLSLGTMVLSIRNKSKKHFYTVITFILTILSMLTTEYFYGLEFVRPLIIYFVYREEYKSPLKETFKVYLPYLIMVISIFIWRYQVSKSYNYSISFTRSFLSDPFQALIDLVETILGSVYVILFKAPAQLFDFSAIDNFGTGAYFYSIAIAFIGFIFCYFYFYLQKTDQKNSDWGLTSVLLGLFSIIVGGLSFIVTSLTLNIGFPTSRSLLSLSFGASLVLVGLLDWLFKSRQAKIILLSSFISLTLLYNFGNAISFRVDWERQSELFNQLIWRAPGLKYNTILYSVEIPISYTYDNALDGPLNWIYDQDPIKNTLGYYLVYLDVRDLSYIEENPEPVAYYKGNHFVNFNTTSDQSIAFYYKPPNCLRVLHPVYDQYLPDLNTHLKNVLSLTNLDQITIDPDLAGELPTELYPPAPKDSWCYFYQKADLARQFEDWALLVDYGDQAFLSDLSPIDPIEYIPFIQGYAFNGDLETAFLLSEKALKLDPKLLAPFCPLWADITDKTNPSDEFIFKLEGLIDC